MIDRDKFGPNPFAPEFGLDPPYLAGRGEESRWWRQALATGGKKGTGRIALMYGPRGTGKTSVMSRFKSLAAAEGCDVVSTNVAEINKGQTGLADRLLATVTAPGYQQDGRETGARGGVKADAFVAGADGQAEIRHTERFADPMITHGPLAARLNAQARKKPLAILIDEMHAAEDMSALQELVNAGQEVVKEASFFLLLVGTPGLPQTLKDAKCTFAERAMEIGIGLLNVDASKDAILTPLLESVWRPESDTRLAISDDALDIVVRDSQGYPYFLQVWGHEMWEYGTANDKDALARDDILQVQKTIEQKRQAFYQKRGSEIRRDNETLAAANAVALVFEQYKSAGKESSLEEHIVEIAIADSLAPSYPDYRALNPATENVFKELVRIGYIWSPPGKPYMTAGIPSYMSYAKRVYNDKLQGSGLSMN